MSQIETQKQSIADYLMLGLELNPKQAWELFSCSKVSTRIGELERENRLPFVTRGWKNVFIFGRKTKVRTYRIASHKFEDSTKPKTK